MVESKSSEKRPLDNDEEMIRQTTDLMQAMERKHLESLGEMVLTQDMAVQQPFEESFNCSVCFNVVVDPRQCKECESLNCSKCL